MPPDPTDVEDTLHAELLQGRTTHALAVAGKFDVWLSAHLADLMIPLALLEPDIDEGYDYVSLFLIPTNRSCYRTGFSVRDTYVLTYASYLQSDPGLWRLTVDYLCTCGDVGKEMADQVLLRVPLKLGSSVSERGDQGADKKRTEGMDIQDDDGDLSGVVRELNATCFEYKREPVRRIICQVGFIKLSVSNRDLIFGCFLTDRVKSFGQA